MKILKKTFVIIFTFLIGGGSGYYLTDQGYIDDAAEYIGIKEALPGAFPKETDMDLFWGVWNILKNQYVYEDALDTQSMVYGAIKGMVDAVDDPYTVFMDPEETNEFTNSLNGDLQGIGAELSVDNGQIIVVNPLKDSPAEKAGIKAGDVIYKINDEFASDLSFVEAVQNIRGEEGTPVNLTILRKGADDAIEMTVIRAKINIDSVDSEMLDDDIVHISINQFADDTARELKSAMAPLILNEPKGIILDLRSNGGGYLDKAVDVVSYFLDTDLPVVKTQEKNGMNTEILKTITSQKLLDVPMVVLVNDGSASASEIVAGALKDHKRAVIMGTTTFGKGSVQAVEYLEDGSSLRITIAKWLTPNGVDVNKVGLAPDIVVELYEDDFDNNFDRQLDEASKYLENLK